MEQNTYKRQPLAVADQKEPGAALALSLAGGQQNGAVFKSRQ